MGLMPDGVGRGLAIMDRMIAPATGRYQMYM